MDSSRIKILSRTLIDQIAAGEVIVRPASAVKELVENSLDAGATSITIEISDDARSFAITDDGSGMSPEEAPLALERHATSKISSLEDLVRVNTRGFRGEALASIAAVSRLTLVTRTPDSLAGTRVIVEGGDLVENISLGAPIGTMVQVRDLFYNTPARLKFMRSESTEIRRILQVITQQALSFPSVGFSLLNKGKKLLEFAAKQTLQDRLRQIFGSSIEGMLLELIPGDLPVQVTGFVAKPESARKDRSGQYLFVNQRPISSRLLTATFEQAFEGIIMANMRPLGAIFIALDPEDVDVNVHPTKEEVRFRDERMVGGIVHRIVAESLRRASLVPYARIPDEQNRAQPSPVKRYDTAGIFSSPDRIISESFEQKRKARLEQTDLGIYAHRMERTTPPAPPPTATSQIHVEQESLPPQETEVSRSADEFWEFIRDAEPLGQIADTYIAASAPDALLLIDQHAAHERIMYEKITFRDSEPALQHLLIPITFDVDISQITEMERLRPHLAALGIEVEPFGGQAFVIQTLPADLVEMDAPAMIREVLELGELDEATAAPLKIREEIMRRMACHSAIRAGQKLSREEMVRLIKDLQKTRFAFTCPHGRPTMILLTKDHLARQFKR
ncbi:MAG TPA: DNA mismatch repair endonuclease MutL [Candidatus Sumerlaeota bacterium]|nr:MAG: DNA mismatch repair protein MutL [candidate division BRC1 bacterium ADurb.Bin183]HOE63954.1 DNA mismatch repair endonuclease MutL [Candidatus Sumerlaeota bacterium]HRR31772.1 DNA mismatch repair endonuclease MutL [Candidatus Sumerlaeia bacterium]HON50780.1 DNA mismatch repair endonuclease MutL [Candidatus Sumerlaeota bacterium]HOR65474.1 DNA mismatch repair endonuclease MutL [Candidatus Sumerlaeota bacterium]